jgi:hypothetical protein
MLRETGRCRPSGSGRELIKEDQPRPGFSQEPELYRQPAGMSSGFAWGGPGSGALREEL